MTTNSEKVMTVLSRWNRMKKEQVNFSDPRPAKTDGCTELYKAEKWRLDIVEDLVKAIGQVQNPGLGEFVLRDLNDEINNMLEEKLAWEKKILELGGPDHAAYGEKLIAQEKLVSEYKGYKYFGAVRDLPGVKELFMDRDKDKQEEKDDDESMNKNRLNNLVDLEYYNLLDENLKNDVYQEVSKIEKGLLKEAVDNWNNNVEDEIFKSLYAGKSQNKYKQFDEILDTEEFFFNKKMDVEHEKFVPIKRVPTQTEVKNIILEFKKEQLLNKYK